MRRCDEPAKKAEASQVNLEQIVTQLERQIPAVSQIVDWLKARDTIISENTVKAEEAYTTATRDLDAALLTLKNTPVVRVVELVHMHL